MSFFKRLFKLLFFYFMILLTVISSRPSLVMVNIYFSLCNRTVASVYAWQIEDSNFHNYCSFAMSGIMLLCFII